MTKRESGAEAAARPVRIDPHGLEGILAVPAGAKGLVIFAHGSGSGRLSPRNTYVAAALQRAGFATLLLDLLTPEEERNRANVFDIPLLATRLVEATDWAEVRLGHLPVGYSGASTGAGAALRAAARADGRVRAVVSRGGRPDLAGAALVEVKAPTLLLVGSLDTPVIDLNRRAQALLRCPSELAIVPGASHLFEEPGTLDEVIQRSIFWFDAHLAPQGQAEPPRGLPFADRRAAGRALAARLQAYRGRDPLVLALPRGGVPVAFEVARALDADLDLLLVRKLGAPGHEELGIGAVVDGANPRLVLNDELVRRTGASQAYLRDEMHRQLQEIERRRRAYLGDRAPIPAKGRVTIVVDDGIATGGTVRAALRGIRTAGPAKLILAVPVAPAESLAALAAECDELVCLAAPQPFHAVGAHYRDFTQTTDEEVRLLLAEARAARLAEA